MLAFRIDEYGRLAGGASGIRTVGPPQEKAFLRSRHFGLSLLQERMEFRHSDAGAASRCARTILTVVGRSSRGRPTHEIVSAGEYVVELSRRRSCNGDRALALDPPEHIGEIDIARARFKWTSWLSGSESRVRYRGDSQTELTRSRLPTQLLEQRSQRVQFGAKAAPVPDLQAINCPIIMPECVTGSLVRGARRRSPGAQPARRQPERIP